MNMNTIGLKIGLKAAAVAALGVAAIAPSAQADDCWGWGGGFSISYSSHYDHGHWSVGYSSPTYISYGGPRYYGGYGYGGGYDCFPTYRTYRYYDDCAPRYYYRPSYREYYRPRYDNYRHYYRSPRYYRGYCSTGDGFEGYYVSSSDETGSTARFRSDVYAGDPNLSPAGYKVASAPRTDLERAESLDPQWAGGAIAMLRKGEASDAIVALEQAAYPETFGVAPTGLQNAAFQTGASSADPFQTASTGGIVSDMGGTPVGGASPAPTDTDLDTVSAGNPEAIRMLGLAMIADGQIDEGALKIVEAYRLDPTLASTPIDERLFPSEARFDVRDLVRKVSVRANRTNAPEAWFALGVLMQAEGRDSVALDMVLKASAQGLSQDVISPMADSLRRVVYGRG